MNGLPYYKAYPRDFIEGTIGMDFETKGAYRLVLDLIYMQGGELPDDARYISGLLGCSIRKWKSLRETLVRAGKIEVSGEFLTNKRAEKELETLSKLQDKQRENRSRPNKNNKLQEPRTDHTEPDTDIKKEDKSSSKKRASRLPENWVLPRAWGEWAVDEGWSSDVIRQEAEKFKDYWHSVSGAKAAKLDWQATWRNWMRNCKAPRLVSSSADKVSHDQTLKNIAMAVKAGAYSRIKPTQIREAYDAGLLSDDDLKRAGVA